MTKTDARGISTAYTYDVLNRATLRNYSDATPDISYVYDNPAIPFSKGKLTKTSSSVSETKYNSFDSQDRILSSSQIIDGQTYNFGYTYNLSGDLLTQTYPSGKVVKYDYNSDGDLARVSGQNGQTNSLYANSFSQTANGEIEQMRLGNGKWETTKFNSLRQITQMGLGSSATDTSLWKLSYKYGEWENNAINTLKNNGNLARQTITTPTIGQVAGFTATQNYTFDSLDRLKSSTEKIGETPSWKQTFNYDRFGNRNFDTANTTLQSVESNISKVVNPEVLPSNNQYKTDQDNDGISDYLYDLSGNVTKDAKGRTFVYDGENRQISALGDNLSVSYAYNGDGKRVKTHNSITNQTTIFVYDASNNLAAEYTVNVPPTTTPTISYLTEDALGSVRAITDSSGKIKARRDFLPFGEEIYSGIGTRNTNQKYSLNGDDTRKKFATYQRDAETNLDFAQSRYYSPMQGRFTSPDEFKGGPDELFDFEEDASDNPTFYAELDNPQSLNKYQYTYNNPYKYNDPTGHNPWWLVRIIPAIVVLAKAASECIKNSNCRQVAKEVVKGIVNRIPVIGRIPVKQVPIKQIKNSPSKTSTAKPKAKNAANTAVKEKTTSPKIKKDRTPQGAQDQRESIQKAQEFNRKQKRPDKIRSINKSKQNEATELKRIKNLKDAEEKFKP